MSKLISVFNQKGGVGKTTVSLNLAFQWARTFKVLLIDADSQSNLTQTILDSEVPNNLNEIIRSTIHGNPKHYDPIELHPYLHFIPASVHLAGVEFNNQFISFAPEIIRRAFAPYTGNYDFVIIDCPNHLGVLVKSLLGVSDALLIPTLPDHFSMRGIFKILDHIYSFEEAHNINLLGILFNQFQKRLKYHQSILGEAQSIFGDLVIGTQIRQTVRVSEAHVEKVALCDYNVHTPVQDDYEHASEELIERLHTYELDKYIYTMRQTA